MHALNLPPSDARSVWLCIGTSAGVAAGARGIYIARYDCDSGRLSGPSLAAEVERPSFLAFHPGQPFLYAVGSGMDHAGREEGIILAFKMDVKAGRLFYINRTPSGGLGPCYILTDRAGANVLVANYRGGSVSVLPVLPNGGIAPFKTTIRHSGHGPNPKRQDRPHAHCIILDPSNRFALAADLGTDEILVYAYSAREPRLSATGFSAALKPGAGPRHITFHPSGNFVYSSNELNSTITVFAYDGVAGRLSEVESLSSLPRNCTIENYPAEILVHPSGRYLYASNRGHDSIAVWEIDSGSGRLTPRQHQPTLGAWPRHFTFDPAGRRLLAANQNSGTVAVFDIDPSTGQLASIGHAISVPSPTCLLFAPGAAP